MDYADEVPTFATHEELFEASGLDFTWVLIGSKNYLHKVRQTHPTCISRSGVTTCWLFDLICAVLCCYPHVGAFRSTA
jgi:hypothetical protein